MSTPQYADAAGAVGMVILADNEILRQKAGYWRESIPYLGAVPEVDFHLSSAPDLASKYLFQAISEWPNIHRARVALMHAAADELVAWVDQTSQVFTISDQTGADRIFSSVGPTLV